MIRNFLALSVVLLASAGFAAAQDFSFTYTGGSGDTASGTLIATPEGTPGEYTITGITDGFFDGSAITLLGPYLFGGNDNLLLDPAAPDYLDFRGISFVTASSEDLNLYDSDGSSDGYQVEGRSSTLDGSGTLIVTQLATSPTPEPSSLLLLGTGLLGICGVLRRKVAA